MRDLWKIMEEFTKRKVLVSFKSLPGRHAYFTVHTMENESFSYDAKSIDELEKQVVKDWGHLIPENVRIEKLIASKLIPLPPGFPRP